MKTTTYSSQLLKGAKEGEITNQELQIAILKDIARLAGKVQELERQLVLRKDKGL